MTVLTRLSGTDYPLKITANEFLALADAGLFERYGRTELIEGEVWTMNAVHQWHARAQGQFIIAIDSALRAAQSDLMVYGVGSVSLSEDSVPEPDLSIVAPGPITNAPLPLSSLRIAIELADTTREVDLGRKALLYARGGVPEYWVADREQQSLIRFTGPGNGGYADQRAIPFGQVLHAATIARVAVDTACLIG
jgi:Uma2 family endonuclease